MIIFFIVIIKFKQSYNYFTFSDKQGLSYFITKRNLARECGISQKHIYMLTFHIN